MAANPQRNWARIYQQGWSLAMRDPLGSTKTANQYSPFSPSSNTASGSKQSGNKGICWRYNKNKCTYGINCRFEHKCSYCGGNHMAIKCYKKNGQGKQGKGSTSKNMEEQ